MTTAKKKTDNMRDRRKMFQAWQHLEKAQDLISDLRIESRKTRKLDEVSFLSDAMFHAGRSKAYLRYASKARFYHEPKDLEVYK